MHRQLLNDLVEHPIGVCFDGYTPLTLIGLLLAMGVTMREVAVTGTFGPLSLLVPAALAVMAWNAVAATMRFRKTSGD